MITNAAYSFYPLRSCNVWRKYMISTRKMLPSTSRSITRKYSLIAIMAEFTSHLSAIVMQLVREFASLTPIFQHVKNFIFTTHSGIAYWFFSPAQNVNFQLYISFFPLPNLWNMKLNFLNDIEGKIQLRNPPLSSHIFYPAFVFERIIAFRENKFFETSILWSEWKNKKFGFYWFGCECFLGWKQHHARKLWKLSFHIILARLKSHRDIN